MNDDLCFTINPAPVGDVNISAAAEPAAPAEPPQQGQQPKIYGDVPQIPVLEAVEGIRFDFNDGIRILFPHNGKEYHVTFSDIDTGIILYSADTVPGAYVTSVKKFYIKFRLIIHEKGGTEPIFTYDYDAKDKEVMIQLPVGTLGDSIGWFSYVERFQQKHQCKVICVMTPWIAEIVKDQYPQITFIAPEDTTKYAPYACYYMGLFFRGDVDHQPIDFRYIGLHRTAGYILG
ncbi:MAG: autotransporter strand-loop-strand O-heptosyltransferase, partial [Lentisphaeria bacterium]|nr:autotransporter strand-loop-strand O-heptosyltransferase [Lentisphaeria bacterium]